MRRTFLTGMTIAAVAWLAVLATAAVGQEAYRPDVWRNDAARTVKLPAAGAVDAALGVEMTTVADVTTTPAAGKARLWVASADGKLHVRQSDGTDGWLVMGPVSVAMERTIRVAADGTGDWATIGEAITAALALGGTGTIVVYPGTYPEQGRELPDGWSLVGVDRKTCIISMASTNYDSIDARTSALVSAPGNSTVANLTIYNTKNTYPSVALNLGYGWAAGMTSGKTPSAENCTLIGGKEDPLYTSGSNAILVENCSVTSTGGGDTWSAATHTSGVHTVRNSTISAAGNGNPTIWFAGAGTARAEHCNLTTVNAASYGIVRFASTGGQGGTMRFDFCDLRNADDSLAIPLHAVNTGTGFKLDLNRCVFSSTARTDSDVTISYDVFGGDVQVGGLFSTFDGGIVTSSNIVSFHNAVRINKGTGEAGSIEFYDATGDDWAMSLYRGDDDDTLYFTGGTLNVGGAITASGAIEASSGLKTGSVERLSSTGEVKAVGLNTTVTQWRYFDAVTYARGNVAGYGVGDSGANPYNSTGWMVNDIMDPQYIWTGNGGATATFAIPYETGTTVTRVAVRWRAQGNNDGVKLTIQERDETGTTLTWTTIGAAQTYVDAGTPFPVTPSVYDMADFTLAAGKCYRIAVESVYASVGVDLVGVGEETSKRAY